MDIKMITKLEEISLNAWPSIKSILYDGWILRVSDGVTRRANSINPIYGSSLALSDKIQYCEDFYLTRGLPIVYKLTSQIYPTDLDASLHNLGYIREIETSVQTITASGFNTIDNESITINDTCQNDWLNRYISFNGYDRSKTKGYENIINHIVFKKGFLDLQLNGQSIGCGLGVIEADYIGIFDVVVHPAYRKMGYGKAIVESLINWGNNNGAKTAYLQVITGNTAALNLYNKIGFKEMYKYWYRVKYK